MVNDCRSYLFTEPEMLRLLLASGMDPNLPNWLLTTPLHDLCARDNRGRPRQHRIECATILLDAGAMISAKDDDHRSTPLAWAARHNLPDMVELLLARVPPPTCRTTNHGPRPSRGRPDGDMTASSRFSAPPVRRREDKRTNRSVASRKRVFLKLELALGQDVVEFGERA